MTLSYVNAPPTSLPSVANYSIVFYTFQLYVVITNHPSRTNTPSGDSLPSDITANERQCEPCLDLIMIPLLGPCAFYPCTDQQTELECTSGHLNFYFIVSTLA